MKNYRNLKLFYVVLLLILTSVNIFAQGDKPADKPKVSADEAKAAKKIQDAKTFTEKLTASSDFIKKFPAGSKVFITSLGQDGLIQGQPNAKGEILVFSNSLRLQVHWTELKPPEKQSNPTAQLVRKSSHFSASLVDEDRTIDLRGKTVEEAIGELELLLDRAVQHQEDRIKIIHGHGTEVLKKSIRSYLSRNVLIKQWKAGTPETGGDGVTWAELRD